MQWSYLLAGLLVISYVNLEAVRTTLRLGDRGTVTSRFASLVWSITRRLPGPVERRIRSLIGPLVLGSIVWVWLAILWIGWVLLFFADEAAVLRQADDSPADFWSRLYFVGYGISTLGIGDYVPSGAFFQTATFISSLNGFVLISLSITHMSAVIGAAVGQREVAGWVLSLGSSGEEAVLRGWTGNGFAHLEQHLINLTPQLTRSAKQQAAYPLLSFFSTSRRTDSIATALAVLDDTLLLLSHGVAAGFRPHVSIIEPLQTAIDDMVERARKRPDDHSFPRLPTLDPLRAAGIPTVSDSEFATAAEGAERRERIVAFLAVQGWKWPEYRSKE
jgi:hypothetical protein